jgi:Kef-type K+ transport system membrane component KefB
VLILLSIFKVLVKDDPPVYEYFIPVISSLGYLVVLGGSVVTWMPGFIQNKIIMKFHVSHRELVMFTVMTGLLLAYLPMLYYSEASYLTGAFLAGVSFLLIPHAHHTFMEKTHGFISWLLRVFFAATIGFQVPVKQFSNPCGAALSMLVSQPNYLLHYTSPSSRT